MVHYVDTESSLTLKIIEEDESVGIMQRGMMVEFFEVKYEVIDYKISTKRPENLYVFLKKRVNIQ